MGEGISLPLTGYSIRWRLPREEFAKLSCNKRALRPHSTNGLEIGLGVGRAHLTGSSRTLTCFPEEARSHGEDGIAGARVYGWAEEIVTKGCA